MADEKAFDLGPLAQVPPGEGRVFAVDGIAIAVFHDRAGKVYATDPKCPHADGPLADGLVGHGTVVCPLHEQAYDLATGEGTNNDCRIKAYSVNLSEDKHIVLYL